MAASQSAVLRISDGTGGEDADFRIGSRLENSAGGMAEAIDDENLEFMRMFAYTGDSISDRGHPFAAQCPFCADGDAVWKGSERHGDG